MRMYVVVSLLFLFFRAMNDAVAEWRSPPAWFLGAMSIASAALAVWGLLVFVS